MGNEHYLIHDSDCELCRHLAAWIQRHSRPGRLVAVGFDDPRTPGLLADLPRQQWRNTFHLILPDGRRLSGDDALPHLLQLLPAGWLYAWPLTWPVIGDGCRYLLYSWLASRHQ